MKIVLFAFFILVHQNSSAQTVYSDSIIKHQQEYLQKHEVVKGKDKSYISFFAPDSAYRIIAKFEKTEGSPWFKMKTSGLMTPLYRVYGQLSFRIGNNNLSLNIYQSQSLMGITDYKDYLFIPFTDATAGVTTYAGGRYIDLRMSDVVNGTLVLDFNKAYNP